MPREVEEVCDERYKRSHREVQERSVERCKRSIQRGRREVCREVEGRLPTEVQERSVERYKRYLQREVEERSVERNNSRLLASRPSNQSCIYTAVHKRMPSLRAAGTSSKKI